MVFHKKSVLFWWWLQIVGGLCLQEWIEQPRYTEVNPGGSVVLKCIIANKMGECRWEQNGTPLGIYPSKYEWFQTPESGDCSLKIYDANVEFDDATWQCQVTSSIFNSKDALISQEAKLVVRESPDEIFIQRVGDEKDEIVASAGEDIELECIVNGGNPPSKIVWYLNGVLIQTGHNQDNNRASQDSRKWISISRLVLPVNKQDNQGVLKCVAEHAALSQPLFAQKLLNIHYPPSITVETSSLDYLEEGKDPVTLTCKADSNPPANIQWRKNGLQGVFSQESVIQFSPVTRRTSGLYSCTAQNAIGLSEPSTVEVQVIYSPRIISIGPKKQIHARIFNKTLLTCEAEGNPSPKYQWLQKLPTQEVLIRGFTKNLLIENVTYDQQGEFVCKAINHIRGEERTVQSEPILVQVSGAPQVIKYSNHGLIHVRNGDKAVLKVQFCSDPLPKQSWHLGDLGSGSGNNIILAAGTGHGRFIAETIQQSSREDCYIATLKIDHVQASDSRPYEFRVYNQHGSDNYVIQLSVGENLSKESVIAVGIGCILTILLMVLLVIYCIKTNNCCCCKSKKNFKSTSDMERNNIESSAVPPTLPPPDALHVISKDKTYINYSDPVFNDSKESLRPDIIYGTMTNLNRTNSSSGGELNNLSQVSYNDLCFPKTSNYGSMKKKSKRSEFHHQK